MSFIFFDVGYHKWYTELANLYSRILNKKGYKTKTIQVHDIYNKKVTLPNPVIFDALDKNDIYILTPVDFNFLMKAYGVSAHHNRANNFLNNYKYIVLWQEVYKGGKNIIGYHPLYVNEEYVIKFFSNSIINYVSNKISIKNLEAAGIYNNKYFLMTGYSPINNIIPLKPKDKKIDILIYGNYNVVMPYRTNLTNLLRQKLGSKYNIVVSSNLYGNQLDNALAETKIVVHIPSHPELPHIPWPKITYLQSKKIFFIIEDNPELHEEKLDSLIVSYKNIDDLISKIDFYTNDNNKNTVNEIIEKNFEYISNKFPMDNIIINELGNYHPSTNFKSIDLLSIDSALNGTDINKNMTYRYMIGKKIFIIGGSGSLGNELISRYIENNKIVCYSRDECKHWKMGLTIKSNNISYIIGDIRDKERLKTVLFRESPDIIIIAAALKHIDKCEYSTEESINTNIIGTKNVVDIVEEHNSRLNNLETVCFVSTDKACSPVNVYGMCKALSECIVIEKAKYVPSVKFVAVRYGNVLNSRGSIIPILHDLGKNPDVNSFKLTDERMTRFVMTLEQSVDLIDYAIKSGSSGEIIIPQLISMKVKDLLEIFSEIYNKPITVTGIRVGEKMLESLINETQSMRIVNKNNYIHILPPYAATTLNPDTMDYNSTINPVSKDQLKTMLSTLKLI